VPLRAANARILIEQSIGRGLRLPYGKRTGVKAVDRLNIVAHDKFQEIVDEANRPESAIHLETVLLDPDEIVKKTKTVVSQSGLAHQLGIQPEQLTSSSETAPHNETPTFTAPAEIAVAQATYKAIQQLESQPSKVPTTQYLKNDDIQAQLVEEVARKLRPSQMEMEGVAEQPDIQDIVKKATELVVKRTINVPRILVVPKGEVASGFHAFQLELSNLRFPPITEELWVQFLRTGETETVGLGKGGQKEKRLEDYVVRGLVDFDDINYDQHADLLYDLASQTVKHFLSYLSEEDARKVLSRHQQEIVNRIHTDMQAHYWEDDTVEYEVVISKGFTELKGSAYTASSNEPIMDYKVSPKDKSNMSKYLFGGFKRCLYPVQKFDAEGERILSVILDRETEKWFKPAKGQFQIFYNSGTDHPEYQPDFIAETQDAIYMLEPKASNKMCDVEVLAKKEAAEKWCQHASDYAARHGEKPWKYALISHDKIAENMSIEHLGSLQ